MSTMSWNYTMTPTRLDHWRKAFHEREVATLPQKLAAWVSCAAVFGTGVSL